MSSAEAIDKLQKLSAERAGRVFALIEDLSELEVLECAEDLKDAREALAKERERLATNSSSRIYYYGIIPAAAAGLAVVTQSFPAAMIFTVLYISSG